MVPLMLDSLDILKFSLECVLSMIFQGFAYLKDVR